MVAFDSRRVSILEVRGPAGKPPRLIHHDVAGDRRIFMFHAVQRIHGIDKAVEVDSRFVAEPLSVLIHHDVVRRHHRDKYRCLASRHLDA